MKMRIHSQHLRNFKFYFLKINYLTSFIFIIKINILSVLACKLKRQHNTCGRKCVK